MKVGDLVMVKECTPDMLYNDIMYSDRHGDFKGVCTTVIGVQGSKKDKIKLECAPEMLFGKDMLIPTSGSIETVQAVSSELAPSLPSQVVKEMKDRHKKFDGKFTEKEVFREAFRDKLDTILTIKLSGK